MTASRALYRVMLATGLRRGEALALHWRDVDLDAAVAPGALDAVADVQPGWNSASRRPTSRGAPCRSPSPPSRRCGRTASARPRSSSPQAACGSPTASCSRSEIGTPLEPRNVLRRFEALAERAGLRGVHLHTLRHSAASFLLAAGTHTKVVQEHLGHCSYAITADIYSHVAPAQQREAADKLEQAIHW